MKKKNSYPQQQTNSDTVFHKLLSCEMYDLSYFYPFIKHAMFKLIVFNFRYVHTYNVNLQTKSLTTLYAFKSFFPI